MEQFEYELTINEAIAQIVQKIDDDICKVWEIKKEDVLKSMKSTQILDQLKQWLNEEIKRLEAKNMPNARIPINYIYKSNNLKEVLIKIQELEGTIHN